MAAAAPRGVKRLVNIYRLARTRRGQEDRDAVLGGPRHRPEFPLIALMAAVETGQKHAVAEWFYDQLKAGGQKPVVGLLSPTALALSPSPGVPEEVVASLLAACQAASELRENPLTADHLLAAARLVRRYSFNRYR